MSDPANSSLQFFMVAKNHEPAVRMKIQKKPKTNGFQAVSLIKSKDRTQNSLS